MSLPITVPADYTGELGISQNKYDVADLPEFITRYEKQVLQDMLGCALYDDFIIDWDGTIFGDSRFQDLYLEICNDEGCRPNRSRGIKAMLKGFIYFYYARQQRVINSTIGNTKSDGVASSPASPAMDNMLYAYNDSVRDYKNIQWYISLNSDQYPKYKGINTEFISPI